MEITYNRPKLTSYQKAIVDCPERFTVCEASTKAGKTTAMIVWLFEQALQLKPGQFVWWIAPVYGQALIAFNRIRNYISVPGFFVVHETHMTLTLPNGGIIAFKTADKPNNLYGEDVYAAVFDEFTRAKEQANHALRSTLTKTRGKVKYIGNVRGKGNWGYRMAQKAKAGEPGHRYFKITCEDAVEAGILDREEIEQARRDLPEAVFKELYMAEPAENGSNPFGFKYIDLCITPLAPGPAVAYGVDLAKSTDWTVIVGLNADRDVCHFERFQMDWKQTTDTVVRTVGDTPTAVDATGVGDPIVEDLQRKARGVEGVKFTSTSKQMMMEGLSKAVQEQAIGFPEGVVADEMRNFEFTYSREGRAVRYAAPAGLHDDCVCALALAHHKFNPRAIPRGKYILG